jgi:dipeptidase E
MNLALFSRGLAADGSTLPFVRQELHAFYPAGTDVLIITAASGNSERAVDVARTLIAAAGHQPVLLHEQQRPSSAIRAVSAFFIGGGNVFRLAETMHRCGWLEPIRAKVITGTPYAGISAGAVIARRAVRGARSGSADRPTR